MTTIAGGVFSGLHPCVRRAIGEFQHYLRLRPAGEAWPRAQRLIQRISDEIHYALGTSSGKVCLDSIISLFDISVRHAEESASRRAGALDPVDGGFELRVFGQQRREELPSAQYQLSLWQNIGSDSDDLDSMLTPRGRFTMAHELGHAFFYHSDHPKSKPQKLALPRVVRGRTDWRIEGLCHDFARALLVPNRVKDQVSDSPTAAELVELAKQLSISEEPLVRRLLHDWGMWPRCIVVSVRDSSSGRSAKVFRGIECRRGKHQLSARSLTAIATDASSLAAAPAMFASEFDGRWDWAMAGRRCIWAVTGR